MGVYFSRGKQTATCMQHGCPWSLEAGPPLSPRRVQLLTHLGPKRSSLSTLFDPVCRFGSGEGGRGQLRPVVTGATSQPRSVLIQHIWLFLPYLYQEKQNSSFQTLERPNRLRGEPRLGRQGWMQSPLLVEWNMARIR